MGASGQRQPLSVLLLLSSIFLLVLAIISIVPVPWSFHQSLLGYPALCSFAPASTFLCLAMAAIFHVLRITFFPALTFEKRKLQKVTSIPFFLVIIGLFLTAAVVSGILWYNTGKHFTAVIAQAKSGADIQITDDQGVAIGNVATNSIVTFTDGTFRSSASAGSVNVEVECTFFQGRIKGFKMIKAHEITESVATELERRVVLAQGLGVDVVSGATASSNVLLLALESAFHKAAAH